MRLYLFDFSFDGNSLDRNSGVVSSSIIICLNGVFIMSAMCCKFLLRFVVFLVFVHYLTVGIDFTGKMND